MCAMCVVADWGRTAVPGPVWTPDGWTAFRQLLLDAGRVDELTGQPKCEDPEKLRWATAVEKRLAALERSTAR